MKCFSDIAYAGNSVKKLCSCKTGTMGKSSQNLKLPGISERITGKNSAFSQFVHAKSSEVVGKDSAKAFTLPAWDLAIRVNVEGCMP